MICSKIKYSTKFAAGQAQKFLKIKGGQIGLRIYFCKSCNAFHLGHTQKSGGDFSFQQRISKLLGK